MTVVDLEENKKAKKEKKPKPSIFVSTFWLGMITIIIIVSSCVAMRTLAFVEKVYDDTMKLVEIVFGTIQINRSAEDFKYADANKIEDQLKQMGFKKVYKIPSKPLRLGFLVKDNTIDRIQIKGIDNFEAGKKFDNGNPVYLYTYSLANNYKTNRLIAIPCVIFLSFCVPAFFILLVRKQKIKSIFALILVTVAGGLLTFSLTNENFKVGEVLLDTKIVVQSEKNLIWSKYPIEAVVDGKLIDKKIKDGETYNFIQGLSEGKHVIEFINSEDNSITTSYTITVDEDATYTFKIAKEKEDIKIVNNRPAIQHGIVEDAEENISEEPTDNITQATVDPTFESDTLTSQAQ